jgi:hypothetical protein
MNETSNMNKHGNELLKFAIDLGGNEIKYINIYDDTNPEELAYNFCYVNHLDYNSLIQLREKIKNALINNKRILTTKESTEIRSLLSNDYDDLSKPVDKINKKNEKIQREIFENLNENSYFKNKKPNTNNNKLYKSLKNNKIPKKNNSLDKTNYSYRAPTICSSTRKKLTLSNNLSINDSNDIYSSEYISKLNYSEIEYDTFCHCFFISGLSYNNTELILSLCKGIFIISLNLEILLSYIGDIISYNLSFFSSNSSKSMKISNFGIVILLSTKFLIII